MTTFYHYTSPQALAGITGTRSLWFTQASCVNDPNEFFYGVERLRTLIDEIIGTSRAAASPPLLSGQPALLAEIRGEIGNELHHPEDRAPFIFSLCESGDDPVLWRCYCPPEGGIAVGFDIDRLRASLPPEAVVEPCLYSNEDQSARLRHDLLRLTAQVAQERNEDAWQAAGGLLSQFILRILPFLKNPHFEHERETRIALPFQRTPGESLLRGDRGWLRVYRPVQVDLTSIVELRVGPGRHSPENFRTLNRLVPELRGRVKQSSFQIRA
jgi:hypothetical protein